MDESRRLELQKRNVELLAEQGEPKFTKKFFLYTSGQIGNYFIQSTAIENNGLAYATAIDSLRELIEGTVGYDGFDAISGGESRDWDFSNPIAVAMQKPHAKLYKQNQLDKKNKPLGASINGRRFVHVADLNNEGSSIRDDWYPQITEAGGTMSHAFFYIDRLEDGVKVLDDLGIEHHSVIPFDDVTWSHLFENGYVSKTEYDSLSRRLEDKTTWAHAILRKHTDHLIDLLKDPKTQNKAEKVLHTGYPEIRDEVIDKMKDLGYKHEFVYWLDPKTTKK